MMRILFFCHYFPPETNAPAIRTYEHCIRWVKQGHDVTIITCQPNHPSGTIYPNYKNRILPQVENVDGIRVVRVWTYLAANAGTVKRILNFLSYMISAALRSVIEKRPDVVIATSPQFFCGWAGVFSSWLRWRPFVLEVRDLWPESIVTVGAMNSRWLIAPLEWAEKKMYRSANLIVTVGQGYREGILKRTPSVAERTHVVTNGVDVEFYKNSEPNNALLEEHELNEKFVVTYVGTLGVAHGLEVVIRAAKQMKQAGQNNIGFLLVGDGARLESLRELAREMDVMDLVKFTGRVSHEKIPSILSASDACLVHLKKTPLFQTVIPSKIFEIMAIGKPIIMGVRGEAEKIVLAAKAGIVMEPESETSLMEAVQQLVDDPNFAAGTAVAAREYVAEHYNRDRLANCMLDYIQSLGQAEKNMPPAVTSRDSSS